jgi:hypothetical protein
MATLIKRANNLVKSEDGFYTGFIVASQLGIGKKQEKNGRDIEEIEYSRYELITNFEGTTAPIQVKTYTGSTINDEPVEIRYAGRGEKNEVKIYNRFTTLLLKLGIVKESELLTATDEMIEKGIEALNGRSLRCKVGKNKDGFYAIEIDTIELIDEAKQK